MPRLPRLPQRAKRDTGERRPAGARGVAPASKARAPDRAVVLLERMLAHCQAHREVTTRKGAKTFQVRVDEAGLTVSPPGSAPIAFSRVELLRVLRAILELRSAQAAMTVENLKVYGVGPEGLYIWGILGHMKAN